MYIVCDMYVAKNMAQVRWLKCVAQTFFSANVGSPTTLSESALGVAHKPSRFTKTWHFTQLQPTHWIARHDHTSTTKTHTSTTKTQPTTTPTHHLQLPIWNSSSTTVPSLR